MESLVPSEFDPEIIGDADPAYDDRPHGLGSRHRRIRALALVVAVGAILAAGPKVAAHVMASGGPSAGVRSFPAAIASSRNATRCVAPAITPENADQRTGRQSATEIANLREDQRLWHLWAERVLRDLTAARAPGAEPRKQVAH